eukprot:s2554_g5.t1
MAAQASAHRGGVPADGGEGQDGGSATLSGSVEDFVRVDAERQPPRAPLADRPADAEQPPGDPWTAGQDPWSQWWDSSWQRGTWWDDSWGQWRDWRDAGEGRGRDYADPPAWPGWANYRLWKRAVTRWDQSTDVAVGRRAERVFKSMDWDLQARFEHLDDVILTSEGYLLNILNIMDVLAGEKEATDMRRVVRRALFEGTRKSEETVSQFALRREQEFAMAERYVPLPADLKGILLEEHAALGKQGTMNLRTLTGGSTEFQTVSRALKILDLEEESIISKGKSANFVGMAEQDEKDSDEESDISINTEDETEILAEIDKMDVDEKAAVEIFMAIEREKRSWKENKKLKQAQRKDRRHFADRDSRPYGRKGHQKGRRGMNVEAIKKVSRCSNCGDRGHWAEDCKKPYRSKAERLEQERNSKGGTAGHGKPSAFVFLGGASASSFSSSAGGLSFLAYVETEIADKDMAENFVAMAIPDYAKKILEQFKDQKMNSNEAFLSMPAGHAIIDPGAGQDLIGEPAFLNLKRKLAAVGLQPIQLNDNPGRASGIGGQATTLYVALVPTILGGAPGIVRVTVVKEDVPHLLSIGLLESAGSVIDTKANVIKYQEHGTQDKMYRLKTGHRTVDITLPVGVEDFFQTNLNSLKLLSRMPRSSATTWLRLADRLLTMKRQEDKEKVIKDLPCPHPQNCVVTGRNQYGSWEKCLRCKEKLSYTPFSKKMDKVKTKDTGYVPTNTISETQDKARQLKLKQIKTLRKMKNRSEMMEPSGMASGSGQNLERTLVEANSQLLTGLTSVLSQAITPLVSGQQAMMEMQQQSMASQAMVIQTVQQGQGHVAEMMNQMTQLMVRSRDEEDWDQIPNLPPP